MRTRTGIYAIVGASLALVSAVSASHGSAAAQTSLQRIPDHTTQLNYTIHCSGCHKADGSGEAQIVPDFRGQVAAFLVVPEGRAYLSQVPGSTNSFLSDRELAEVLNYIVTTFDPEHVPADFIPYTEREVARLRRSPVSDALSERRRLLEALDNREHRQNH